jgi:hypothetical protein
LRSKPLEDRRMLVAVTVNSDLGSVVAAPGDLPGSLR